MSWGDTYFKINIEIYLEVSIFYSIFVETFLYTNDEK
jgi:hypothetical protein